MVKDIIKLIGVPAKRNRFAKPPAGTYIVWTDYVETDGADGMPPSIFKHDVSFEMYSPKPDEATEMAIESALSVYGLQWVKQDRYWLDDEQTYQTVYDFSYIEKRRN